MATEASATRASLPGSSPWRDLLRKEDWWAVWLGVGLTLLAVWLFQTGSSLKWLAVTPKKWSTLSEALADLRAQAPRYLALLAMWSVLLAGETGGDFLALDARDGRVLYRFYTGGALAGGISTYAAGGHQYIAVASGNLSRDAAAPSGAATIEVFALP